MSLTWEGVQKKNASLTVCPYDPLSVCDMIYDTYKQTERRKGRDRRSSGWTKERIQTSTDFASSLKIYELNSKKFMIDYDFCITVHLKREKKEDLENRCKVFFPS